MLETSYWNNEMENFRDDFSNKAEEIFGYLSLLHFIENAGAEIVSKSKENTSFIVTADIRKTLRGAIYILLYNLVESTMREAICYVHDSIHQNNTRFENLRVELKKEIIKRIKSEHLGVENFLDGIGVELSVDISLSSFNSKKLFSGNIDREEIKSKAITYGFSTNSDYSQTKHGEKLRTVKLHRNDLAHGNISFSEIGRNATYTDLEATCNEVIAYLDEISSNIEECVRNKSYLDSSRPTA